MRIGTLVVWHNDRHMLGIIISASDHLIQVQWNNGSRVYYDRIDWWHLEVICK